MNIQIAGQINHDGSSFLMGIVFASSTSTERGGGGRNGVGMSWLLSGLGGRKVNKSASVCTRRNTQKIRSCSSKSNLVTTETK